MDNILLRNNPVDPNGCKRTNFNRERQLNYVKNHQVTLLISRFVFMRIYKYHHNFIQDVTQN